MSSLLDIPPSTISSITGKWKHLETGSADSTTAEIQGSSTINISTKTVCRELHGMFFHGREAPLGVMSMWPSTFVHVVYIVPV